MADAVLPNDAVVAAPPSRAAVIRGIDRIVDGAGFVAALALAAMTAIVVYEVISRYVFNEPTIWVTEIGTYLFVAITFLGMAVAQRGNAHIRVEILVDSLPTEWRTRLELATLWLALLFTAFCTWHGARFTFLEYVHGARDWGLLSTPQWLPQLPMTLGLGLFIVAMLRDIHELRPPRTPLAQWTVPVIALVLTLALIGMGRADWRLPGTRFDWGSILVCISVVIGMVAWSGWRIALATTLAFGALALVFYLSRGTSQLWLGSLLGLTLIVLLFVGVRVAFAMGLVGLLGLYFLLPMTQLPVLPDRAWTSINSFTLTAVPSFVLMGALLVRSGITTELFDALVAWFGRTKGGLAHASVAAAATFAAVCGSSLATAATLGSVAAPEMVKRGYSPRLTYGVVAAGATLGILIPPSIAMIIYGNVVGVAVTQLFLAGIIPGLLLSFLFMVTVFIWGLVSPRSIPEGEAYPMSRKIAATVGVLPFVLLIVAVLGSLYLGIATPTEAGAIGAVAAFLMAVKRGRLDASSLYACLLDTVKVTAFIMLIVVGAAVMSWVFDYLKLPRAMVQLVTDAGLEPWLVFAIIVLIYLILGCFIESIAMMLMTLSVTFPVIVSIGLDPIWFGVILVLLVEIGLVTPPVGLVLFVLKGMSDNVSLKDIAYGVIPFIFLMLGFIWLLYFFPGIVTWLPSKIG
ncbi:TRAP transporter large permease subunit [Bosea sp. BH3]|uniref:TRAP transporter large permease subunit n=1 Tax=Bosea sp. BH3 TaxID=2871701 RepID=UPI0021CB2631|nr:TRAP transporter large permease subunit [Bosea sp. BH3]MCU4178901.1 TRAP transporter large permease subunit [Bosea sp. BH3]